MGIEDVKFTAMNMYKYKGLRLCKRWPCSRANAHVVYMGVEYSTSHHPLMVNSVDILVLHGQRLHKRNPSGKGLTQGVWEDRGSP